MLVWLDGDGTILSASHGRDFTPLTPAEKQIGQKPWDMVPADIGRMWRVALADARQTGHPYVFETRIPLKGRLHIRECRLMPVGGHGFLAVIRDVTELRELQGKAGGETPAAGAQD
jgi:PAS domain-containing protein